MNIRRANLDSMAGKSPDTIKTHRREVLNNIRNCELINKTPSYQPRGPFPLRDTVGMGCAVDMIQKAQVAKGKIKPWIQFDTMRRPRSTHTKVWESSPQGVDEVAAFTKGTVRVKPTTCPTQSEWMQDFLHGAEYRMGYDSHADHAVPIEAIVTVLDYIKRDAEATDDVLEANQLWKVGAFICMTTSASLRGYEGYYADLAGIRADIHKGKEGTIPAKLHSDSVFSQKVCNNLPHVAIHLLGQFKAEGGINTHVINVANESMSGLKTRWWIEKLIDVCDVEGRFFGPAFASADGTLASPCDYNATFRTYLKEVQANTDLIGNEIDVDVFYSLSRTPRKSAQTRAQCANIAKKHQGIMNRWRSVESAQGRRVRFNMRQLYSEAVLLMPTTWLYSYAL